VVVRPREQFLGTITQLDKYQGGTVTAFGAEMDDVSGVVIGSRALQPATGHQPAYSRGKNDRD